MSTEWPVGGLCKGKHMDMWYPPLPDDRTRPEKEYFDLGKMVCEHCPIQRQCRSEGEQEDFGLWGGRTPRERRGEPYRPPDYALPLRYLSKLPDHTPGVGMDPREILFSLKRFADRRR